MNDFQQYQQQLQMQRMMEMQQARMQQLQQQQNNMMLFSQQRAYLGSMINPLGSTPLAGGAAGMGLMADNVARQSLLGAALDAGRFNFFGLGTSRGLFGTGIGNRIGFSFADANRSITSARAQDALEGFGTGFRTGLIPGLTESLGFGFINRMRGTQGLLNINDRAADVQNAFQGLRGAGASGVEALGISRGFATRALINSSRRLGTAMPEFTAADIGNVQGFALGTMSTAQLTQAARSESDFDKMMEGQEALLKKIAENTKMSVDEIKETNKVFKGQGGVGGSAVAQASVAEAMRGLSATTSMSTQDLQQLGAGFRSGALALGLSPDATMRSMVSRLDDQQARFNRGEISEVVMSTFGGSTSAEQLANRQQFVQRAGAQFIARNMSGLGLLEDPIAALRAGGEEGALMLVGQQMAADPINARANALYSREGLAREERLVAQASRIALQRARSRARLVGGGENLTAQYFAENMGYPTDRRGRQFTLDEIARIDADEALMAQLESGNLPDDMLAKVRQVGRKSGLGDRSAEVIQLMKGGASFQQAVKQAYTATSEDLPTIANALGLTNTTADHRTILGTYQYTQEARDRTKVHELGSGSILQGTKVRLPGRGLMTPTIGEYINAADDGNQIDPAYGYSAGRAALGQQLLDENVLNIVNEGRPERGTPTNPVYVLPGSGASFGEMVGSD